MQLTLPQLQAVKAWVEANAAAVYEQSTADAMNAVVSPNFWVWRTSVTKHEAVAQPSPNGGTTFTWAGNGFIGRSVGELECWNQLFNSTLTCNPSLANVRQAFSDIFSGSGNAAANRTHLLSVARRKATVAEKLLATGTGTAGDPATMNAEGEITLDNLIAAANS